MTRGVLVVFTIFIKLYNLIFEWIIFGEYIEKCKVKVKAKNDEVEKNLKLSQEN